MDDITFSQLDHLHSKYVGTGNADTTKKEWMHHMRRDQLASAIGHINMAKCISRSTGECLARTRYRHLEEMLIPAASTTTIHDPPYHPSNINVSRITTTSGNKEDNVQPAEEEEDMDLS